MSSNKSVHPNALLNHENAVVPRNKLEKYALDPTNLKGQYKARLFKSILGFEQSDWELLKQKILEELPYHEAQSTMEDEYGKRYKVILPIKGLNDITRDVVVTWIIKTGTDFPSLDSTWVKKR